VGEDSMTRKLLLQAFGKYVLGLLLFGVLLFVPAGTVFYPNGWLLMAVLFIPMFIAGIILIFKNPSLLKKRLNAKEEEKEQKSVVVCSGVMFLAAFIVAGLNFRFQWFLLPNVAVIVGTVFFLLAYAMYAEVLRENTYLSRTVEVQENQKVIDTGLYGIVRHPMYSATLVLFLSMGIILGSLFSFGILLFYIPIIAKRMKNEEAVLEEGLEGYKEYKTKVKYKVIPYIW
jgi:protein-S-isoprenylcysteine O-methyltransferase Ste14